MQCTIVAIKRTPRVGKTSGKPFVSVGIKTDQHGEKWLSGFANTDNANWETGTVIDIEVETKGDFLNFKTQKRDAETSGDKFGVSASEIKNYLDLKMMPMLERNNAGIQKLEFLITALGERLEYYLKQGAGEEDVPEPDFGEK